VQPGSESETLLDLLVQWEELRAQGKEASPEELCPDDAELQARLRERLARRQRLEAAMELPFAARREPVSVAAMLPIIDGYEIGELLGRGGMGLVFRATQKALKRPVALKIILSGAHAGAEERTRFRTEAEAVARLHHPGIVHIYDVGEQAGCPYLALEFVEGGSLAEQLHGTPMAPRRAAQLILDLARAVQHAHEQGIVHRDLKPANVLVTEDGVAKITDFGLAKLLDAEQRQTRTGAVLGSPSYMAPEQAEGKARAIGPAADIYALGAILYELLTGRPPFLGASFLDTLDLVRTHEPAPPQTLQPKVPVDLATICMKCLEKNPDQRYLSAAALADDLARFLRGDAVLARGLTLFGQAARLARQSELDVKWGNLATLIFTLAPLPFLSHLAVFVILRNRPEYGPAAVAVTLGMAVLLLVLVFIGRRAGLRVVPPRERRQITSTYVAHFVAMILVVRTIVRMTHPASAEEWFLIYAVWLILWVCIDFSLAANAGILYFTSGVGLLLALLAPFFPFYLPLFVGSLVSFDLTMWGIVFLRVAREARTQ
jgi:hypothetical protein